MNKIVTLFACSLFLASCVSAPELPMSADKIPNVLPTHITETEPTITALPTSPVPTFTPEPTAAPVALQSSFPHIASVAYPQIPNKAPAGFGVDSDGMDSMVDNRYAYYEQVVCVDYVDLRWSPSYNQPPKAWAEYGDVLHVEARFDGWALVESRYWVELKYLCDF